MWYALLLLICLIVAACALVLALAILRADGKIILRWRTLFVSILAAMAYDWFFVPPIYSLAIEDPQDWLGCGVVFLTTGIVWQALSSERG